MWRLLMAVIALGLSGTGGALAEDAARSYLRHVPVTVDGEQVRLQMRIYEPQGPGPFPTFVYHHGSTGYGTDPARFRQPFDAPGVAAFFVRRGWAVVMPARRGRAGSDGLYDEGFSWVRAWGYSCIPSTSLAGADRALRDIEAAMTAIRAMPFVDARKVVVGGWSRGGALSVAYAGRHPEQVRGVINFVGGWLGWPCPTMGPVNRALLTRGATYPGESLWLYADDDPYYSLSHSRANFSAFVEAGGKGFFHVLAVPGGSGHWLPAWPVAWKEVVDRYLAHRML